MSLVELSNKQEHIKSSSIDIQLHESRYWDLSEFKMKRMFRALELIPWMSCILSPETIVCDATWPREDNKLCKIERE